MDHLIHSFFNFEILSQAWPLLLAGFWMTVGLALLVVPLGLAGGLLVALASTSRHRLARWLVVIYVDFFRAFPPLVLLMFIAFGLPFLGFNPGAFIAVALSLLLNTSSYYGEIFRAGIESKLTSLASVVALPELLYAARQAQSLTYNATPIIAAGIIYLVCLWPLVRLLSRFEHRQIALH
jgi:polar amino acid transport system permease protein